MVELYANTSILTDEDKIVIEKIIEGCTRLICKTSGDDPLKYARARLNHKIKLRVHTFVNLHIHDIIKESPNIRPLDIRKRLPEKLQGIRNADLSRILKSTITAKILSPKTKQEIYAHKPGHPFRNDYNDNSISGPKSLKEHSGYQKELERVLSKPEARDTIHYYLVETGLLRKYHVSQKMKACYIEKENDKEAAWNIIESAKPPNIPSQSTYEEHFDTQNQLLSQDNKNKIREKAEAWARSFIERHNANDYIYLYRMGGSYYLVPSN